MIRIILLLITIQLQAQTSVYVSDQVEIPVRSEKSSSSEMIRMVTSGDELFLLQTTDSGWTQVETKQGETGWIASRYLMGSRAARSELAILQDRYNATQHNLSQLKKRFTSLEKQFQQLSQQQRQTLIEKNKAEVQIEHIQKTYQDAIKIEHKNRQLTSQILQQASQIQLLRQNTSYEQERSARNWFIVGALVLLVGAIIGAILGKIFFQKRKSYL